MSEYVQSKQEKHWLMLDLKANPWSIYQLFWKPFKHNIEGGLQLYLKGDPGAGAAL